MTTDTEREDDKYAVYDEDDMVPGARAQGKEGRRSGSYTGLMAFRAKVQNGAQKRLGGR
jgi:hypothetical protein